MPGPQNKRARKPGADTGTTDASARARLDRRIQGFMDLDKSAMTKYAAGYHKPGSENRKK